MLTDAFFPSRSQRGTALIVAMAIIMLLAGLGTVLLMDMSSRSKRAEGDAEDVKAFEAAEAGLDAAIMRINADQCPCVGLGWRVAPTPPNPTTELDITRGILIPARISAGVPSPGGTWQIGRWKDTVQRNGLVDLGEWTPVITSDVTAGGWVPAMDNQPFPETGGYKRPIGAWAADKFGSTINPWPRPQPSEFNFYAHAMTYGDVRYFTYVIPWASDGIDNDRDGNIDGAGNSKTEVDWYTIYSTGFSNPSTPEGKFITVEASVQRANFKNTFDVDSALEFQVAPYKPADNTASGASSTDTDIPLPNSPASAATMLPASFVPVPAPSKYVQFYPYPATNVFCAKCNGNPSTLTGNDYPEVGNLPTGIVANYKAAIGAPAINASYANGPGSGAEMTGISVVSNPVTNPNLISGGMRNDLRVKDNDLERFILAAKNSADYTVNLAQVNPTAVPTNGGVDLSLTAVGSSTDYKVVYAKGTDVAGVYTERPIRLSGNGTSYGVLVVEIDNPANSWLDVSGQFLWNGLVIVAMNKRFPTGSNDSNMDSTGGGTRDHYRGAAIVYHRNYAISSTNKGEVYGMQLFRTRGTSDLKYSSETVMKALGRVRLSAKVKSWRRLD